MTPLAICSRFLYSDYVTKFKLSHVRTAWVTVARTPFSSICLMNLAVFGFCWIFGQFRSRLLGISPFIVSKNPVWDCLLSLVDTQIDTTVNKYNIKRFNYRYALRRNRCVVIVWIIFSYFPITTFISVQFVFFIFFLQLMRQRQPKTNHQNQEKRGQTDRERGYYLIFFIRVLCVRTERFGADWLRIKSVATVINFIELRKV